MANTNSFFRDGDGKRSMGRLLGFVATMLGCLVAVGGLVGFFVGAEGSVEVVLYGVLAMGGGETLKVAQKFAEKK